MGSKLVYRYYPRPTKKIDLPQIPKIYRIVRSLSGNRQIMPNVCIKQLVEFLNRCIMFLRVAQLR